MVKPFENKGEWFGKRHYECHHCSNDTIDKPEQCEKCNAISFYFIRAEAVA